MIGAGAILTVILTGIGLGFIVHRAERRKP